MWLKAASPSAVITSDDTSALLTVFCFPLSLYANPLCFLDFSLLCLHPVPNLTAITPFGSESHTNQSRSPTGILSFLRQGPPTGVSCSSSERFCSQAGRSLCWLQGRLSPNVSPNNQPLCWEPKPQTRIPVKERTTAASAAPPGFP